MRSGDDVPFTHHRAKWRFGSAISGVLIAMTPLAAVGHWTHHGGGYHYSRHRRSDDVYHEPREPCGWRLRDDRGRFVRCAAARAAFEGVHPCPSTGRDWGPCPGYVVDHIVPLKRGGADDPSNMQWQTIEDAKAKDRIE
jgi:5-methylcytosine-specific restriction endonuclease McrA